MQTQIDTVRHAFPGTQNSIYLQTSASGLLPLAAREAMLRYLDSRISHSGEEPTMFDAIERVRSTFAQMLGPSALAQHLPSARGTRCARRHHRPTQQWRGAQAATRVVG